MDSGKDDATTEGSGESKSKTTADGSDAAKSHPSALLQKALKGKAKQINMSDAHRVFPGARRTVIVSRERRSHKQRDDEAKGDSS